SYRNGTHHERRHGRSQPDVGRTHAKSGWRDRCRRSALDPAHRVASQPGVAARHAIGILDRPARRTAAASLGSGGAVVEPTVGLDARRARERGRTRRAAAPVRLLALAMEPAVKLAWLPAIVIACLATALAMYVQNLLRTIWQIRSLPERVMEWL